MGVCSSKSQQKSKNRSNNIPPGDNSDLNSKYSTSSTKTTSKNSVFLTIPLSTNYTAPVKKDAHKAIVVHNLTHKTRQMIIMDKPGLKKDDDALNEKFTKYAALVHPNIQRLFDIYYDKDQNQYQVIKENVDGINFYDYLQTVKPSEGKLQKIIKKIVFAIMILHSKDIAYGELCGENIIFNSYDKDANVKLLILTNTSFKLHALHFKSPESIKGFVKQSGDIWSLGVLIYFSLSGLMPFQNESFQKVQNSILKGVFQCQGHEWELVSADGIELVQKLLVFKEKERPNIKQTVEHSWFSREKTKLSRHQMKRIRENLDRMQKYTCKQKIQQATMMIMIEGEKREKKIVRLFELFKKLDTDHSGTLSREELMKGYIQVMTEEEAKEHVEKIMQQFDCDGNGTVDYNEFLLAHSIKDKMLTRERVVRVFKQLDVDQSGTLSHSEIRRLLLRMNLSEPQIRQAIREFDTDRSGEISLEEFVKGILAIKKDQEE